MLIGYNVYNYNRFYLLCVRKYIKLSEIVTFSNICKITLHYLNLYVNLRDLLSITFIYFVVHIIQHSQRNKLLYITSLLERQNTIIAYLVSK